MTPTMTPAITPLFEPLVVVLTYSLPELASVESGIVGEADGLIEDGDFEDGARLGELIEGDAEGDEVGAIEGLVVGDEVGESVSSAGMKAMGDAVGLGSVGVVGLDEG